MEDQQQNLDFPEIISSTHNQKIIMTRIDPDPKQNFFISVSNILDGTAGDRSTLQTYEEFCNCLAQPNILPISNQEEKQKYQDLIKQKKQNQAQFKKRIEDEKNAIKKLLTEKLQDVYKNKCNELVEKLQNELDGQNKLFADNYEKLSHELTLDREKEAGLTKYEEIKKKMKELHTPVEIENYLQDVYKKKKIWKNASESLQTLSQRTEDFYSKLIEKQFTNIPQLSNIDKLLQSWTTGIDQLITKVNSNANCFKNIICPYHQFIPLQVHNIQEFTIITNEQLKQDTELQINFSGKEFTENEMQVFTEHLSKLNNLVHLVFDITGGDLTIKCIEEFVKPFENLKNISTLEIKAYGIQLNDQGIEILRKLLDFQQNLTALSIDLGANKISIAGLTAFAQSLQQLSKLQCLSLQIDENPIKQLQKWNQFSENLAKIMPQLIGFKFCFNECTQEQSILQSLIEMIEKATLLKYLHLELGSNEIKNELLKYFITLAAKLPALKDISLHLNNNKIDVKGANKIGKLFKLNISNLASLDLNLSGNNIKTEGVKYIIDSLKIMDIIKNLKLNFRNMGIKRGLATQMKAELEEQRDKFEKIEFLA